MDALLLDAWVAFLENLRFNIFWTITFERPASNPDAVFRRLRRYSWPGLTFACAEEHSAGGIWHAHGLLRIENQSDQVLRAFCSALWQDAFQRWGRSRFEVLRGGARAYVVKYLSKNGWIWEIF